MFDKLVESDTAAADFKNRSRYFMVSSVVVGILFLTAVVYSLYAAEVGLGSGNFEIAELLAPVETMEPERQEPAQAQSNPTEQAAPNRNSDMARVDEPTVVPTSTSVLPNTRAPRTWEPFNPNLPESVGIGSPTGLPNGTPQGTSRSTSVPNDDDSDSLRPNEVPPPAVIKPPTVVRKSSLLNSSAIHLPKPPYPRLAGTLNLEDTVNVQVMIDEKGNVVSAKAASGHPFFRSVSEQAARNAKFSPTILNGVAVKVTGVIVYRFKRN